MKPLRLLLLEDNPLDAELLLDRLASGGVECDAVRVEKREAFESALQSGGWDAILADYSLPSFDGASALKLARECCPETPFISVSGALGEELAIEMLKSGATDYVLKTRLERLLPSLHRALREAGERAERKRAEQERARAEEALRFLAEASAVLASSLDYDATLSSLARLVVPHLADGCIVNVFEGERVPRQVAITHIDPAQEEQLRSVRHRYPVDPDAPDGIAHALRTGQSQLVSPVTDEWLSGVARDAEHAEALRRIHSSSYMIAPLVAHERVLGAISFFITQSPRRYGPDDLSLAEDLARRAAVAVDNARLYRETQDAVRARDEFLATLSHELRTPLNAILGWTQLVRTGNLDEATTAQALETIERNTRAQTRLIEDLLEVSRIITGKLRLQFAPVEMAMVATAALDAVRPAAEAKSVAIEYARGAATGLVAGDPHRLQQVVWNLVSNAIKFTPRGGRVTVCIERVDTFIRLTVSDTGQGIAADFLPYVFDRFRQADSSSTRAHGGLGLGLAIVRHLVELHGGTVRAHSAGEGQGASFIVQLPVLAVSNVALDDDAPAADIAAPLSALPREQPAGLSGVRVLVVDDQADSRRLVSAVLEHQGAQVTSAPSVAQAWESLQRERPDVLISDIGMPDEDGYSFIRRVREREAASGGPVTPALALTAYARQEDHERALANGFHKYAVKPVEAGELISIVAQLAGRTAHNDQV